MAFHCLLKSPLQRQAPSLDNHNLSLYRVKAAMPVQSAEFCQPWISHVPLQSESGSRLVLALADSTSLLLKHLFPSEKPLHVHTRVSHSQGWFREKDLRRLMNTWKNVILTLTERGATDMTLPAGPTMLQVTWSTGQGTFMVALLESV